MNASNEGQNEGLPIRANKNARGIGIPVEGNVWAGPFTVANEVATSWPGGHGLVVVADVLGEAYCYVPRDDQDADWTNATERARHLAQLLNDQQHWHAQGQTTPAEDAAFNRAWDRFATPEELVDRCWDRLLDSIELDPNIQAVRDAQEVVPITRAELAEFMVEAALHAMGADGLDEPVMHQRGTITALLQSLSVLAREAKDGHAGWSVVADRAGRCLDRLVKDVTRFLELPGLLVTHPTLDGDLFVRRARFGDDGRITLTVASDFTPDAMLHQFPINELWVAGPVSDAVRVLVSGMATALIEQTVQKLVDTGQLQRMAGDVADPPRVHDLQAEPEYVMEPGSPHAQAVQCPDCQLPLHECTCVPMDD